MLEEFVNPFRKELLNSKLYNLSSGRILKVFDDGKKYFELFVDVRLLSNQKNLHATFPRLQVKLFMRSSRKVDIQANGKSKTFEANSNIISTLLAVSTRKNRLIDFKEALKYPLTSVPLNIAHPDDSRRCTQKSKLTDIIIEKAVLTDQTRMPPEESVVIDLMALIHARHETPRTYEDLIILK